MGSYKTCRHAVGHSICTEGEQGCYSSVIRTTVEEKVLVTVHKLIEDTHELHPLCGQKVDGFWYAKPQYVNIGNGHVEHLYNVDRAFTQFLARLAAKIDLKGGKESH